MFSTRMAIEYGPIARGAFSLVMTFLPLEVDILYLAEKVCFDFTAKLVEFFSTFA